MALSAGKAPRRNANVNTRNTREAVVNTGVSVWEGGFYCTNSSGVAIVPTNGAGDVPLGFARNDYSAGETGVFENGQWELIPLSGAGRLVGRMVYATSDNVFTMTAGTGTAKVGPIAKVHSTTQVYVSVMTGVAA